MQNKQNMSVTEMESVNTDRDAKQSDVEDQNMPGCDIDTAEKGELDPLMLKRAEEALGVDNNRADQEKQVSECKGLRQSLKKITFILLFIYLMQPGRDIDTAEKGESQPLNSTEETLAVDNNQPDQEKQVSDCEGFRQRGFILCSGTLLQPKAARDPELDEEE